MTWRWVVAAVLAVVLAWCLGVWSSPGAQAARVYLARLDRQRAQHAREMAAQAAESREAQRAAEQVAREEALALTERIYGLRAQLERHRVALEPETPSVRERELAQKVAVLEAAR